MELADPNLDVNELDPEELIEFINLIDLPSGQYADYIWNKFSSGPNIPLRIRAIKSHGNEVKAALFYDDDSALVRIAVAEVIPGPEFMMKDKFTTVREAAAVRISNPDSVLHYMRTDPSALVREILAYKLLNENLEEFANDISIRVRRAIINRLPIERLSIFDNDQEVQRDVATKKFLFGG